MRGHRVRGTRTAGVRGTRTMGVLDLAVVLGIGALALFPFLAKAAASNPPALDRAATAALPKLPPPGKLRAPQLRGLPVATAGGVVDRALAAGRVLRDPEAMVPVLNGAATIALGP